MTHFNETLNWRLEKRIIKEILDERGRNAEKRLKFSIDRTIKNRLELSKEYVRGTVHAIQSVIIPKVCGVFPYTDETSHSYKNGAKMGECAKMRNITEAQYQGAIKY